ncbi:MAG: substrate-binding domain-containing protein [Polyangiaceae bacterium]
MADQRMGASGAGGGPELDLRQLAEISRVPLVSVNADLGAQRVASVHLDEAGIGAMAARYLLSRGHRNLTTFRFDQSPFAVVRERAFSKLGLAEGARVVPGWWCDGADPPRSSEDAAALVAWLRGLPKPCGIFTCTDSWGRVVARYARAAKLRVPEDVALLGVDNDVLECELIQPPLSSVALPWRELGVKAASLVQLALSRKSIAGKRLSVAPLAVVTRRSSDALGVHDALVARAVGWIRLHSAERLTVPIVATAVRSSRQRLERRFRARLGRSVTEEIRRARVEAARLLLERSQQALAEVAKLAGFSSAALLSVAFQRELGMPPGAYRRRLRAEQANVEPRPDRA